MSVTNSNRVVFIPIESIEALQQLRTGALSPRTLPVRVASSAEFPEVLA